MKEGKLNLFPDEVLEARRDGEEYYEEPVLLTPDIPGFEISWHYYCQSWFDIILNG